MNQELEEYQDIIEQLKPMINEPEFNQVIGQVAAKVPKQKRFLIKMELKRLARPCIRLIDLRGQVSGECKGYEYEGKTHYLDDIAIEVFERQMRLFGDYTIGVYEAVKNTENNFRVIYKKQQQEEQKSSKDTATIASVATKGHFAKAIQFCSYAQRTEERMNYAVNIELFTELNKSIQATTVDIAVSGLKIKVNKEHMFQPGERLVVQFRGLEGEYTLDKKNGVPYTIISIERMPKEQRLQLKRSYDAQVPSFDAFLGRFIHGNKRRYKVNMDNTVDAILNKTYEQYYTPNFTSVPIYIEKIDKQYFPKYVLANDCNKDPIYYWSDEQHDLKIGYLLNQARIEFLASLPTDQQESIIYAFNHVKGEKVYFYSASREELFANPKLMSVFLGYGARKASWRVYKVQLTSMDIAQAHVPLSLPDGISESVKRQSMPPAPRLISRLRNLSHIAVLTDITEDVSTQTYESIPIKREDIAELKLFGHPRNKLPAPVSMFRFKYFNQRKETRFQLRTKVLVKIGDMVLEGVSEDISVRGLKIELSSFYHDNEDSLVKLSLPKLQTVTQKYQLTDLPYQVKGISRDRSVIHLLNLPDEEDNTAQRFFDELIKNNRSRLKAYKDEEEIPGIGSALRNLYAHNMVNTAFFIKKDGVEFKPDVIATSKLDNRLNSMLKFHAEPGVLNLQFLYSSNGVDIDFIQHTLKKIKTNKKPLMREIMVAYDPSQTDIKEAIKSRFTDQFDDDEERQKFIRRALADGQFIAIKVFIARTGRPDTERLQSEIAYVGMYAIHRAKVMEEQLWSIIGVGDLIDVTDEVMLRYQFTRQHVKANYEAPAHHKVKSTRIEQLLKA
jgi:hypothetical protein